jgi:hypothetical protein
VPLLVAHRARTPEALRAEVAAVLGADDQPPRLQIVTPLLLRLREGGGRTQTRSP